MTPTQLPMQHAPCYRNTPPTRLHGQQRPLLLREQGLALPVLLHRSVLCLPRPRRPCRLQQPAWVSAGHRSQRPPGLLAGLPRPLPAQLLHLLAQVRVPAGNGAELRGRSGKGARSVRALCHAGTPPLGQVEPSAFHPVDPSVENASRRRWLTATAHRYDIYEDRLCQVLRHSRPVCFAAPREPWRPPQPLASPRQPCARWTRGPSRPSCEPAGHREAWWSQ